MTTGAQRPYLEHEYHYLRAQHAALLREHEALDKLPQLDRNPHFRRLEQHRAALRLFRRQLQRSR